MSNEPIQSSGGTDVAPDSLLGNFKGPGLLAILAVAILVHVVVIAGTSIPFLKRSLLGEHATALTKEQRMEKAMTEVTAAVQKIASANGLNPQEITDKLAPPPATAVPADTKSEKPAPVVAAAASPAAAVPAPAQEPAALAKPEKQESKIEADLKKTAAGPKTPGVGDKEDIF